MAGVLVFLGTAVLAAPAATLYAWIAPRLGAAPVTLAGVQGQLSQGRAAQVLVRNQPLIGDLGWNLQALQLLLGRLSVKLDGGRDGSLVDGRVFVVPSGTITLQDFRAAMPLRGAFAAAGQSFVPVEGQVAVDIQTLQVREQWPTQAQGVVRVQGLNWKLGREAVPLGDYEVLVDTGTGGISGDIRTVGGPLEVAGTVKLDAERRYELQLRLRPKPNAPAMLPNLVRSLGAPDAEGWYRLQRKGQLAAPVRAAPADELVPEEEPLPADEIVE
jgi:hypothetical protein